MHVPNSGTGRVISAKEREANAKRLARFKELCTPNVAGLSERQRHRELSVSFAMLTKKIMDRKGKLATITLREKKELLTLAQGIGGNENRALIEELISKAVAKANKVPE